MNIINKKNKLFVIDDTKLNKKGKNTSVKNALYMAVYKEFFGAIDNPKYKNMTTLERFSTLNIFAENWLRERNFLEE